MAMKCVLGGGPPLAACARSALLGGLKGTTSGAPYLPVPDFFCSAFSFDISPGSALSASSASFGEAGETALPAEPVPAGDPGPEAILTIWPSIVTIDPVMVTPVGSTTTLLLPHFNVTPNEASITTCRAFR